MGPNDGESGLVASMKQLLSVATTNGLGELLSVSPGIAAAITPTSGQSATGRYWGAA